MEEGTQAIFLLPSPTKRTIPFANTKETPQHPGNMQHEAISRAAAARVVISGS